MPFQIVKMDNLPLGLFRPTNTLPPGAGAFQDRAGTGIAAMTYHHIISKEKLKLFFDAVVRAQDLNVKVFEKICYLTISKHYTRKATPTSDGYPMDVAFQDNGGANLTQENVKACVAGVLSGAKADRAAANATGAWQIFENFYFWWPANLHHGPRARMDPNSPGFDVNMDDGGDGFEAAAERALPKEHFERLQLADNLMQDYITISTNVAKKRSHREPILKRLHDECLSKLLAVDKYKEPHAFDKSVWKPEMRQGAVVYRLKT